MLPTIWTKIKAIFGINAYHLIKNLMIFFSKYDIGTENFMNIHIFLSLSLYIYSNASMQKKIYDILRYVIYLRPYGNRKTDHLHKTSRNGKYIFH